MHSSSYNAFFFKGTLLIIGYTLVIGLFLTNLHPYHPASPPNVGPVGPIGPPVFKSALHPRPSALIFDYTSINCGFFSVFWAMMQSYIWAMENHHDFFITGNNWKYAYDKGWHDYFQTLNVWNPEYTETYSSIIHKHHDTRCHGWQKQYPVEKYILATSEVFIPHDYLMNRAIEYIQNVIGTEAYLSLYIRRGDKVSGPGREMEYLYLDDILDHIQLDSVLSTVPIFISTDDYTVVESLLESGRPIFTLTTPDERGSVNSDMSEWTAEMKRVNTEDFIVSTLVLTMGVHAWTDMRSNVGRFHKLYAYNTVSTYPVDVTYLNNNTFINPIEDMNSYDPVIKQPMC
jgi:hypothetical protein